MADQPSGSTAATAPAAATGGSQSLCSLGLSANQPAVLFSHTKSATAISYSQMNTTNVGGRRRREGLDHGVGKSKIPS